MRGERSKNEKTVIIKNLFTPELFEKEVELILEYQNNIREECGKCGIVRKVVIYDVSSNAACIVWTVNNHYTLTASPWGHSSGQYVHAGGSRCGHTDDAGSLLWSASTQRRALGWQNQIQVRRNIIITLYRKYLTFISSVELMNRLLRRRSDFPNGMSTWLRRIPARRRQKRRPVTMCRQQTSLLKVRTPWQYQFPQFS